METLGSLRRTNYCGEVTLAMAGQEMTVCGSIARARDKGGIIFADLRDTTGILQLVFDEDTPKDVFAKAESLKSEYVVICRGKLRERAAKTDKIATGDVELYVSELRILSEAQTTPFELRDEINVNDDLRLRYRYLDLRRPSMHEPIVLRSKIMQIIRNYFCENHFTEIETPTLIKSTPEGARDYLVPSRVQPGHFYALPQSPQLYKQILMLSGFDRYFQIARCYRDEDLRADRQPEFTQVDEEMSFVNEDDIMTINEGLIKRLWKEMLGVDVQTPFVRMPWDEAMGRFGSDKPDTRFGLEIVDVTDIFDGTEFKPFAAVLEQGGSIHAIKGISFEVQEGEVVTLSGANGAGKSTTLNAVSGLLRSKTGSISFLGESLAKVPSHKVVAKGLALVPEGRRIFLQMTVQENLEMGAFTQKGSGIQQDLEMVYELFPRLKERYKQMAGTLSGGEQQMLAMGRALMSHPKLLMLDEPSMGLAPILVEQSFEIIQNLHKAGTTILLVEQNAQAALSVADRGYVLETGKIVTTGTGAELLSSPAIKKAYLGG